MRIDVSKTKYFECKSAEEDFSEVELRRLRLILRRLRFLETQVREKGGLNNPDATGGAAFAEYEVEALEWLLAEVGYLAEDERDRA